MSDAVMAESSSYRDSINFYEGMSQFQGELKNYESQQFQLEEEFQRLWTQGVNLPSSSQQSVHFGSHFPLTNQSQLLPNPNNLNYGKNEEVELRRRARNQEILEKLQQLETNASIFAARSERLKMMKNEYESLVRKYSSNRNWINPNSAEGNQTTQQSHAFSFLAQNSTGNHSAKTFMSSGVNTDISGPIKPISTSTDIVTDILPSTERSRDIDVSDSLKGSNAVILLNNVERESNDSLRDLEENAFTIGKIKARPTFLDISSTSESDLQAPLHNRVKQDNIHQDALDDTSIDTTSMSVLPPKSRGSSYMLNISTDGSISETTSIPMKQQPALKKIEIMDNNSNDINKASGSYLKDKGNEKMAIINNNTKKISELDENEEESCSSKIDSTSNSIGDSLMDSVQNKTPESLPKDDSELLHIPEVDEEYEAEDNNDKKSSEILSWSGNNKEKPGETKEEIESWEFEAEDVNLDGKHIEVGLNVDPEFTWANKFAAIGGTVSKLTLKKDSVVSISAFGLKTSNKDSIDGDIEHLANETGSDEKNKGMTGVLGHLSNRKPEAEMIVKEKNGNPKMTSVMDFTEKEVEKVDTKPSNKGNPFLAQTTKQSGSEGNESKKVRLKYDYDDSESEHSNADVKLLTKESLKTTKPSDTKDNDFDDFFDI